VGSLLLGVHDDQGRLVSVGRVGTGWSVAEGKRLRRQLAALKTAEPPFHALPAASTRWRRGPAAEARWVRPEVVAEVAFGSWTPAGQIRHASFVALRSDKEPSMIRRETPLAATKVTKVSKAMAAGTPAARASATPRQGAARLRISNPDRVIDASTGLTKLDLVRYYESVAERIVPHLQGRPVAQVRGPQGLAGQLFFQRHDPTADDEEAPLKIANAAQLLAAAQLNVIEFHTGNAKLRTPDKPDRVVFDLDPGEGLAWPRMQEGAELVRALLREFGLKSWLKTSGGKGLHVVVPIMARWSADAAKAVSKAMVEHLAQTLPDRFVAKSGPANRVGKIFVDYLRNGETATTVAAFSARARPGLGVSMPIHWDQLRELKSGAHWTVQTARDQLSFEKHDPWADYAEARQSLATAIKTLGLKFALTATGRAQARTRTS